MSFYHLVEFFYIGTAGDSLRNHYGMKFSTKDVDNDISGGNCAQKFQGAWWFRRCFHSHLNGKYIGGRNNRKWQGILWRHFKGLYYSYKVTEMKVGSPTKLDDKRL